jgi:hypothetical protein
MDQIKLTEDREYQGSVHTPANATLSSGTSASYGKMIL